MTKRQSGRASPTTARRDETHLRWGEGWIKERVRSDGTTAWQAHWVDEGTRVTGQPQKERARSFPTRDDAEDFLREQLRAKRDGRYTPPSEITVRQLLDDYFMRGAGRWKPNTLYAYRQRAKLYILPHLGETKLTALTTPRLQHWIDGLTRAGRSAVVVRAGVVVIKQALGEAVAIGVMPANPSIGLRLPVVRQARAETWTAPDVARFMAVVGRFPMWNALYRLALTAGLRPGELRALKWGDVDLERGLVQVRRTMSRDADGHVIVGKVTKTGRERSVALAPSVVKALTGWRAAQKIRRIGLKEWSGDAIVFDRGNGLPLDAMVWRHHHRLFAEEAGVAAITLHELRHTTATLELEAGTHPLIVSQRLGHSTIAITLDRYSHVSSALQREAADALDARLFGEEDAADDATTTTRNQI